MYPRLFQTLRGSLFAALSLILVVAVSAQPVVPGPVKVTVDRPDGIYEPGTPATFTVTASGPLASTPINATYTFVCDGVTSISTGAIQLNGKPVQIKQTLVKPGQLICTVKYKTADTSGVTETGAYFDPFKIQPVAPPPADFDEFWAKQKDSLKGDYEPEITPIPSKFPGVDMYHVKIPMPEGRPVQGYLSKPHGAPPKSIGACAYTHGAGVRSSNMVRTGMGMISFDFNAHGVDDGQPAEYYNALAKGELSGYRSDGWETPGTVYFVGMFKRLLRAIDFLTKQPEWDGKTLVVYGGSQGGAQAIVAGALEPRVSHVVAGIPAMCDFNGYKAGRYCGWPRPVKLGADGQPVNPRIADTAQYFDMVNFASRIKCDAFFMTGLIDRTCMSNSVMPAYNALQSKRKMIVFQPDLKHTFAGPDRRAAEKFVVESMTAAK